MTVFSLSQYDRGAIYQLLKFGFSYKQIALRLNCCKATVCNELKRVNPYNPIKAQHDADIKCHRCGRHYALTTVEYVSNKQVIEAIDLINNRPLKVLHWKSAIQAFHYDFIHRLD